MQLRQYSKHIVSILLYNSGKNLTKLFISPICCRYLNVMLLKNSTALTLRVKKKRVLTENQSILSTASRQHSLVASFTWTMNGGSTRVFVNTKTWYFNFILCWYSGSCLRLPCSRVPQDIYLTACICCILIDLTDTVRQVGDTSLIPSCGRGVQTQWNAKKKSIWDIYAE